MRLHTPSGMLDYVEGQYWASAIDTPVAADVLTLSDEGEFLALSVDVSAEEVASVAIDVQDGLIEDIAEGRTDEGAMAAADALVIESAARLVEAAVEPRTAGFMCPHVKRELIFHALCGSRGREFLQGTLGIARAGDIYAVNSWIKENFRDRFSVADLARQGNMSVSRFHEQFKSAVGMGPLQCQKRLRLTEARRLMLDEGCNVTEAGIEVGYESLSQFTRDYKGMFGRAPKEDIANLRDALGR